MIALVGLDKAEVLAALYNASKPQGMGFMQYDPAPMTREEAQELLDQRSYFDYLKGRVMKVSLEGDEFDPWGYNRDNGKDAAEMAIAAMRTGEPNVLEDMHKKGTAESIALVREHLHEESTREDREGCIVFGLGLSDVADKLGPAVDKAEQKLQSPAIQTRPQRRTDGS